MTQFVERVAERAAEVEPTRVLLTVLALPFYVLGLLLGLVWAGLAWAGSAVLVGIDDVRERRARADGAT